MHSDELPDGSGFFIAEIGPREPGFINWLQARPNGSTRRWYFFWLNIKTARHLGNLGWLKAIRWALSIS